MVNKKAYNLNKIAKNGDTCICPACDQKFIKTSYQQVFCKTKGGTICKDKYWNTVTPTKRNNKTRISPASAAWFESQKAFTTIKDVYKDFHPYEGLNDEDYKNF